MIALNDLQMLDQLRRKNPADTNGSMPQPQTLQPASTPASANPTQGTTAAPQPLSMPTSGYTSQPPRPTDTGGMTPNTPPIQPADWNYQGQGLQVPARAPVQSFQHQPIQIPPPPPPPAAPPPASFLQMSPAAAPDYQAIAAGLGSAQAGPQYQTAAGSFQGENLAPSLEQYARQTMANPNRYSTPWMQAALAAINGQIDLSRTEGQRNLAELMAKRGTLGSSIEQEGAGNLEAQLDQTRVAQLSDLLQNMASVDAQDRTAAANIGLGVGQFEQGLGNDRRAEGQAQFQNDTTTARNLESDRQAREQAGIQAAQLADQGAMDRANFGLSTTQAQNDADLARYQAALDSQQFLEQTRNDTGNLQLQGQDLDLRAYQIQQDAIARGQQLDLDTARAQAENELARNQQAQQESQFGRSLTEQQNVDQTQADLARLQQEHQSTLDSVAIMQIIQQMIQNGTFQAPSAPGAPFAPISAR